METILVEKPASLHLPVFSLFVRYFADFLRERSMTLWNPPLPFLEEIVRVPKG